MLNNNSLLALFVFLTMQELYETNDTMLNLAYRLLKKKGYLIMKTMNDEYKIQWKTVLDWKLYSE